MYNEFRFFTPLRCVQNDRISLHFSLKLCVYQMSIRPSHGVGNARYRLTHMDE